VQAADLAAVMDPPPERLGWGAVNGLTADGDVYYVALILTAGDAKGPRLVLLGDARQIEHDLINEYRKRVDPDSVLGPAEAGPTVNRGRGWALSPWVWTL